MKKPTRIYLDYAAATPIDPRVSAVMKDAQSKFWGNSSSLHEEGERAKEAILNARKTIAALLNCRAEEVYFTSGGTEAANIAIRGILKRQDGAHVVCSTIEHPAVLESVKNSGAKVTLVEPEKSGIIPPEKIARFVKRGTALICLMHANNEIGTIQSVREVSKIKGGAYLLVDASQSVLYENVSVERLGADVLIIDGAKMYGPRGAGILIVKRGVKMGQTLYGGKQQREVRPGTENAVNAVGLAEALEVAAMKRESESARLTTIRDYAISKILKEIPGSSLNGHPSKRLPNSINICFPGQDSEFMVIKLDTKGFAVSSASACGNLNIDNPSYVIEALGKKECASSSLRITLGRGTRRKDVDLLIDTLRQVTR